MKKWVIGMVLIIFAGVSVGCRWGGKDNPQRPAPQRKQETTKKTKPDLPPEFDSMEQTALKLFQEDGKDWNGPKALLTQLDRDWTKLQKKLTAKKVKKDQFSVVSMHLAGAEEAVKSRNLFKLREHANEIIGGLQPLKKKYKNAIPPELVELEIGLRELRLHLEQGNWTIAQDLVKAAPGQWEKLKPQTKKLGAEEVGKNIEGSFKELETAVKEKNLSKAQEMVGMLQSDFMDLRRAFNESKK